MSDATDNKLEQVYELIRQEKLEEAAAILQPVLSNEPENADAWWLWANTVTEPEDARQALQKVLQHNPDHQAAQQMFEQLNELYPPIPEAQVNDFGLGEDADFENLYGDTDFQQVLEPDIPAVLPPDFEAEEMPAVAADEVAPIRRISFSAEDPTSTDSTSAVDFGSLFDEDEFDDELIDEESGEKRRRPFLRTVLLILLIFVVGIAVILLLNMFGGNDTSPAAQQVQPPEAVQTVMPVLESTANEQADLLGGPSTAQYEMIDGEPAIILQVCRAVGPDISSAMDAAMEIIVDESATLPDDVVSIAVRLMNCERDDVLLGIYTTVDQFQAYQRADISEAEFRATWQLED